MVKQIVTALAMNPSTCSEQPLGEDINMVLPSRNLHSNRKQKLTNENVLLVTWFKPFLTKLWSRQMTALGLRSHLSANGVKNRHLQEDALLKADK